MNEATPTPEPEDYHAWVVGDVYMTLDGGRAVLEAITDGPLPLRWRRPGDVRGEWGTRRNGRIFQGGPSGMDVLRPIQSSMAGATVRPPEPVPTPARDPAAELLAEATKIVTGDRRQAYGTPEDNFACIAELWTTVLRRRGLDLTDPDQRITAHDVAGMMILMKCARLAESPTHHDSAVDVAGYAACLARIQAKGTPNATR